MNTNEAIDNADKFGKWAVEQKVGASSIVGDKALAKALNSIGIQVDSIFQETEPVKVRLYISELVLKRPLYTSWNCKDYVRLINTLLWYSEFLERPISSENDDEKEVKLDESLTVAYFLSRRNQEGVKELGYSNMAEAIREMSILLDQKYATIKNMRDEFDPYFDNGRVGWYQRPLSKSRKVVYDYYSDKTDEQLLHDVHQILRSKKGLVKEQQEEIENDNKKEDNGSKKLNDSIFRGIEHILLVDAELYGTNNYYTRTELFEVFKNTISNLENKTGKEISKYFKNTSGIGHHMKIVERIVDGARVLRRDENMVYTQDYQRFVNLFKNNREKYNSLLYDAVSWLGEKSIEDLPWRLSEREIPKPHFKPHDINYDIDKKTITTQKAFKLWLRFEKGEDKTTIEKYTNSLLHAEYYTNKYSIGAKALFDISPAAAKETVDLLLDDDYFLANMYNNDSEMVISALYLFKEWLGSGKEEAEPKRTGEKRGPKIVISSSSMKEIKTKKK